MATNTKTAQIGRYQNGTVFTVNVDFVKNNGPDTATGVEVAVDIPTGLEYSTSGLGQGSYNTMTDIWSVGSLIPGQSVAATFSFLVTDDCEGPYTITFTISTQAGCDSCLNNNELCIVTNGVSCCDDCNPNIKTITSDYTVLSTDNTILADGSSNEIMITLPSPASTYSEGRGQKFVFRCLDSTNQVRVQTPSGVIVGPFTPGSSIAVQGVNATGDYITLQSDGTNYYIVSGVLSTPTPSATTSPTPSVTPSITPTATPSVTVTPSPSV